MPIYEYQCNVCGRRFDHWFPTFNAATNNPMPACPACGATSTQRLISRVAVHCSSGDAATTETSETPVEEKPKVFGRKELNQIMEQRRSLGLE